jgi:hypothetical protein
MFERRMQQVTLWMKVCLSHRFWFRISPFKYCSGPRVYFVLVAFWFVHCSVGWCEAWQLWLPEEIKVSFWTHCTILQAIFSITVHDTQMCMLILCNIQEIIAGNSTCWHAIPNFCDTSSFVRKMMLYPPVWGWGWLVRASGSHGRW